jgi:AraC family transcriptional regulator, arabinose operon regulatory protein
MRETPHYPTVTLTADEFRRGIRYDNWRPRGTTDWLLILSVAGAGQVESGAAKMETQAGTVTLYQPGTPQRYFTDPRKRHWHLLWSHFHPRPHWGVWLNWPEVSKGLRSITLSDQAVFREVRQAMMDTIRLSRQALPESMDLAVNAFERALLWINSTNNTRALDERVRHAVDVLAEKLHEPLSLAGLARTCGLSVSRLAHLFSEQIGMPPQQYLEELRLQRAAQLLRSTGLRIGEIAAEAGYAGAFYFSGRFRKKFGKSPSEYRRQG